MSIKKGIYAASMTILNKDLSVDCDSTIKHSEKLIHDGCQGCVLFGSTGQAQLISSNEKKKLIEKLNNSKFKDRFILGTGTNSLNENVELIKFSINNGINRFLLGVPAYYKFGDEGAYSFYANLIQKVPEVQIVLYNFERLFGYNFSFNCPALFVHGKDSLLTSGYFLENIKNTYSNIMDFEEVSGAAHHVPLDKPIELVNIIKSRLF